MKICVTASGIHVISLVASVCVCVVVNVYYLTSKAEKALFLSGSPPECLQLQGCSRPRVRSQQLNVEGIQLIKSFLFYSRWGLVLVRKQFLKPK